MARILLILFCLILILSLSAQEFDNEKAGDIIQIVLPVSAFTSTFIWNKKQNAPLQFVKTMGTSFVLTHSLKILINKKRPNGGNYSFPSGHTSAAFTGASFIEKRYGWKYGLPSYVLASYVGWSRVYANKHDYWDVCGGAIIGIGSSYLFTQPFDNNVTANLGSYYNNPVLNLTINF